ncbi:MAG: single-stranded DNA-binding protein [Bacteroidota bacterium]
MAINNTVTLIGNMGSEAHTYKDKEGREFVGFSVATTDSYQNDKEEWIEKETVWHSVIAFSPSVVAILKTLKKGSRIKLEGSLSYRPFDVVNGDGEVIPKKEASIVARKVEQAPLVKKSS